MSDISEAKVRFPWLLVVPRDEKTVGVFSFPEPEDGSIHPMECVLSSILDPSHFRTGLEVFFPQEAEDEKGQYPFYLLSTYDRILTNDTQRTREILYNFGELRATERVELGSSLPFVYLAEGISTPEREAYASPSGIWKAIFGKLSQFEEYSIYWIEDDINVLRRAGISPHSDQVDLLDKRRGEAVFISSLDWEKDKAKVVWNCNKSAFWSIDESRSWQSQIVTKLDEILGKKRTRDGFNIFIIDLYFGRGKNISIFGNNPIDIIRRAERDKREIHPLIISCTGSTSPYLISRTKAIGADFVIFKNVYGTGHGGTMRGGEETGLFYLLGAIYWPLSIVAHTCKKLTKIIEGAEKEINDEDLTKSIQELEEEIDRLYPRHYAVFWEGWIENLSVILRKWQFALSKGVIDSRLRVKKDFINDLENCLQQARYKETEESTRESERRKGS